MEGCISSIVCCEESMREKLRRSVTKNSKDAKVEPGSLKMDVSSKAEPPPKISKPCFFSFGFHAQSTVAHPHTSVNIEIDAYVKDRCAEPDEDILAWWTKNENLYPILSTLARKYHSASSMSVASKQLFSASRDVDHFRRMRLDPKSAEMILFLNKALPLINYSY